ncbi:TorF family putative porin [uncultured Oxalicibacterium sp.]|uniref:TorF family putative porin n=1 Tax=uncultured Oxalicibacterium sp. TaxID=1168540 RepID=UPI0025D42652|nr:TorF family putative porin [uncultured Oxalicibacterium sp.]
MSRYRSIVLALASVGMFAAGAGAHAQEGSDAPSWTGHVDVVSKYVLRGITTTYGPSKPGLGNEGADAPESNRAALQWGLDYTHPSGFYAGYWASTINYSYKQLGRSYSDRSGTLDFQQDKSIENDFYAGYKGKVGDFGYNAGLIGYAYYNGKNANGVESKLAVSYSDFELSAQTLLNDTVWGNKGDTYWTLNYSKPLVNSLMFTASLGYYTYNKEGKYLGTYDTYLGTACAAGESFAVSGCVAGNAPTSGGFRHLIVGLSQPIANTGITWSLTGIIGGENRFGISQSNRIVAGLSYGF